jgi:hypothetical protein
MPSEPGRLISRKSHPMKMPVAYIDALVVTHSNAIANCHRISSHRCLALHWCCMVSTTPQRIAQHLANPYPNDRSVNCNDKSVSLGLLIDTTTFRHPITAPHRKYALQVCRVISHIQLCSTSRFGCTEHVCWQSHRASKSGAPAACMNAYCTQSRAQESLWRR